MADLPQAVYNQEYVWNYPGEHVYGLQYFVDNKWQKYYTDIRDNVRSLEEVTEAFNCSNNAVRIVKYSRWLANGELVMCQIIKTKMGE